MFIIACFFFFFSLAQLAMMTMMIFPANTPLGNQICYWLGDFGYDTPKIRSLCKGFYQPLPQMLHAREKRTIYDKTFYALLEDRKLYKQLSVHFDALEKDFVALDEDHRYLKKDFLFLDSSHEALDKNYNAARVELKKKKTRIRNLTAEFTQQAIKMKKMKKELKKLRNAAAAK